jgi:hypothetical protein
MQLYHLFLPLSVLAITPVPGLASGQDFYVEGAVGVMEEETFSSRTLIWTQIWWVPAPDGRSRPTSLLRASTSLV